MRILLLTIALSVSVGAHAEGEELSGFRLSTRLKVTTAKSNHEHYYQRLGVPENASQDLISQKFIELQGVFKDSPEELAKVQAAFAVIGRPDIRGAYDRQKQRHSDGEHEQERMSAFGVLLRSNPLAENFYDRVGAPVAADRDALMRQFDVALVHYARNGEVVKSLLEALGTLRSSKRRSQYDVSNERIQNAKGLLSSSPSSDSVPRFLNKALLAVQATSNDSVAADFFKQLYERTEIALKQNPTQSQIDDLVHTAGSLRAALSDAATKKFTGRFDQYMLDLASTLYLQVAKTPAQRDHLRGLFASSPNADALIDVWRSVGPEAPLALIDPAPTPAAVEDPLDKEIAKVQAQLKATYFQGAYRRVGLLEEPSHPGRYRPWKLLGAGALALWGSVALLPSAMRSQVLEVGMHDGLGAMALLSSAVVGGIYGFQVLQETPNLLRRAWLGYRFGKLERGRAGTAGGDECEWHFKSLGKS